MSASTLACYVAVAEALSLSDRALIEKRCVATNPWLKGAATADLLKIADDADSCLRWTEPFNDEHGGFATTFAQAHGGLDAFTANNLGRIAVLACALAAGAVPRASRVERLVRLSAQRLALSEAI
jgi:hypothetical protein